MPNILTDTLSDMKFAKKFIIAGVFLILLLLRQADVFAQKKFSVTQSRMSFTSDAELELIQVVLQVLSANAVERAHHAALQQ